MLQSNPFSILAELISPLAMQGFIIAMVVLIGLGTIIQMIQHKNLTYFLNNAKKAKQSATKELGLSEKTSIIAKTAVVDIGTTSELGFGKRRLAHVLGMYGTILFWVSSAVLVFCYTGVGKSNSEMWNTLWHAGAILTCLGGYWFWFFLRVDVSAFIILYQGCASAETSTLKKNQNQFPPMHVNIAPPCQSIDQISSADGEFIPV